MSLKWVHEEPPRWDEDKERIIGGAPTGCFDPGLLSLERGSPLGGDWWRLEDAGQTVGYGWMDVVWGDAEVLLGVAKEAEGRGLGSYILQQLEHEARRMGVNRVCNTVRPDHPQREAVSRWLEHRGFQSSEDGSLFRAVIPREH